MNDQHHPPDEHPTEAGLADLVAVAATVPEAARRAVLDAVRPDTAPQVGELWRARPPHGGDATLVYLRAITPEGLEAMPVSFDTEFADETALVVPADESPLGLGLLLHPTLAAMVSEQTLLHRLGTVDITTAHTVAAPITSPLDQREEYRQTLAASMAELQGGDANGVDPDDRHSADGANWWPLDDPSDRATLLIAMHQALGELHPHARITPRPASSAEADAVSAVALVGELDAFVLVASLERQHDDEQLLQAARNVLEADQLLNAVCLVEEGAPFTAVVIDRRDVVSAIETPSGELRPPRRSRLPIPIGEALTKFLDATISPFGRLASTVVDAQPIEPHNLAVDVSTEAVRTVVASARGYKVEGKRPGYERATKYTASIVRLVEEALGNDVVDVASILEGGA